MPDLNYKITTQANLAGAQQTGAALDDLNKKAGRDAAAAGALDNEQTKKVILGKAELRAGVRMLGSEFHALGGISRYLFSPTTAMIGGLLVAIRLFRSARKAAQEFRETLERQADLTGLLGSSQGVAQAMDAADLSSSKFFDHLKQTHDMAISIKSVFEDNLKLINESATAEDKIAELEKKRDLARLDFLKATKQITPAEYEAGKAGIETAADAKKRQRQEARDKEEAQLTRNAFTEADFKLHGLILTEKPAEEAAAAAANTAKKAEENLARAKANYAAQNELITGFSIKDGKAVKSAKPGLQEEFEKYKNKFDEGALDFAGKYGNFDDYTRGLQSASMTGPMPKTVDSGYFDLRNKLAEARARETSLAGSIPGLTAAAPKAKADAEKAAADLNAIKAKIEELQKTEDELRRKLEEQKAKIDQDAAANKREAPVVDETNRYVAATKIVEEKNREDEKDAARGERAFKGHVPVAPAAQVPDVSAHVDAATKSFDKMLDKLVGGFQHIETRLSAVEVKTTRAQNTADR